MPGQVSYLLNVLEGVPLHDALRALLDGLSREPAVTTWLAAEPGVTLSRLDTDGEGPFVACPASGGLVRLLTLARPLLVTTQQESELEAILSEPDKEDPNRGALLRAVAKGETP